MLGDRYQIEREVGGGGMSRVFLAEERRLARKVVIKVLPPATAASIEAGRFERGIQVAGSLHHPHIVQLLAMLRLGEYLQDHGDKAKALDYLTRFTALWKNAAADLQPRVREAKARIAELAGERRP